MVHNILGTPQNRKSRIVPGLVEQLNRECSEAEKQEKKNQSLEQKTSKRIILDIKDICRGYEEFMGWGERSKQIPIEITDKYDPTKQQVLEFSKYLINYNDLRYFVSNSPNYLTALMHSSKEEEFEINLQELNKNNILLHYLGYKLKDKVLVVNGDMGICVGSYTKNSKITINGNAGDYVGSNAKNSKITINGNVGESVGYSAENCEIYVRGHITSISNSMINSKIFQFRNNKWVEVRR